MSSGIAAFVVAVGGVFTVAGTVAAFAAVVAMSAVLPMRCAMATLAAMVAVCSVLPASARRGTRKTERSQCRRRGTKLQ